MQVATNHQQASVLLSTFIFLCLVGCGGTTANNDGPENGPEESLICGDGIVGADEACDGGGSDRRL